MSKFNRKPVVAARAATGPIRTVPSAGTTPQTFEGAPGASRDAKSELFLLATTSVDITADTFYERSDARVNRFVALVRHVAVEDPDWIFEFLKWLRGPGNIRTAAIVGAVEASLAMVHEGITGSRQIINAVCQRADEPGEIVAYLFATHGRRIPKPIKRGLADAVLRLYTQRALLKYDTASHAVRFADVIELTHPIPYARTHTSSLFKYAIDRRHNREGLPPESLGILTDNYAVRAEVAEGYYGGLLSTSTLYTAGMTWEDALSLAGSNVPKADLWRAMIPSMAYMALLRNLRNFDEAGLSDEDVAPVIEKLTNPEEVKLSQQLPMRFLSAYRAVSNLRWAYPLEKALELSLGNVPELKGKTKILIDTSSSMRSQLSKSELLRWDAAALFGLALARRCEDVEVYSFSWSPEQAGAHYFPDYHLPAGMVGDNPTLHFPSIKGESRLSALTRWGNGGFFIGGGTDTVGAVTHAVTADDARVVILTDEQAGLSGRGVSAAVPANTMLFTFNLAGYAVAQTESSPTRITIGGLADAMFPLIPQLEARREGHWPWESVD